MRAVIGIISAAALSALFLYLSRYWPFDLWGREGLAGISALRPQGDLLQHWLRSNMASPFGLIFWGIGAFVVLSLLEWLKGRIPWGKRG